MWGKNTKQRRAAHRRHAKYEKLRRWELKNLAFGFLYSSTPEARYPDFIKKLLKSDERVKHTAHLRPVLHDYSELEVRMLANLEKH